LILTDLGTGQPVAGTAMLEGGARVLAFVPAGGAQAGRHYQLRLDSRLKSTAGVLLSDSTDPQAPSFPADFQTFSTPPVLPGGLQLKGATTSSLSMEWAAASDNSTPPEKIVYNIYIALMKDPLDFAALPQKVTAPGVTAEILDSLEPNTEYHLGVRAMDELGNLSIPSGEVAARTLEPGPVVDTEPPEFKGVTPPLEAVSPHALKAKWEPATDNVDDASEIRYQVYLATSSGQEKFDAPATISAPGASEIVLDGLVANKLHFVVVRAIDQARNEDKNVVEAQGTTLISYRDNIVPILTQRGGCSQIGCHGGSFPQGGLNLQTYSGLIKGGRTPPPTVIPFDGQGSGILWRTDQQNPNYGTNCARTPCPLMPLGGRPLSRADLDTLEHWIDQGAVNN
jgi:hypothetical protein